jgi:coenzyme F420-reducing hydrogenase delta subunit/NAD-dependent dihydropyrimidine dehydrogenase PreA subunit
MVLSPAEQSEFMTTCVSRSRSAQIVLELGQPSASNEVIPSSPIAVVDNSICVGCLTCVRACTYGAASIDAQLVGVGGIMGAATISAEDCTGCGLCAAACPTGAIDLTRFANKEIISQFEELLGSDGPVANSPRLVVFACPSCPASIDAFVPNPAKPVDLKVVEMPCSGRVDNFSMMKAFEYGADGVIISGCEPGKCYFNAGNTNAVKRVRRTGAWLDNVGLGANRVRMVHLPKDGAEPFRQAVQEMADDLRMSARGDLHMLTPISEKGAGVNEVVAESEKAESREDAFLREIGII